MNRGGFSWKRLVGISAFKSRVSRKIGIPLTASSRRRKLGASVFNAVGSIAGTLAVAASTAAKGKTSRPIEPKSPSLSNSPLKGVHFCEVKGVTHHNDDGTIRIAAQQLCSVGDAVKLVPEPSNEHDRNAIRVLLQTGEQIGYISARQAARFKGSVHLLTATVHSRVKDQWGNDTVKLRVSLQQQESPANASISAIQEEAAKTREKEGWHGVLVYFENAGQRLYKVVRAEDAEALSQSLQEGMVQVGFIGLTDTPTGIKFAFSLNDGLPTNGIIAKRFLVNAQEWVVTEAKDICERRGDPAPVVGELQLNKQLVDSPTASVPTIAPDTPKKQAVILALKGFLISFTLTVIIDAATEMGTAREAGVMIALAIGAIYIIVNLRSWEKNKAFIRGATIGWSVAVLLLLVCLVAILNMVSGSENSSVSSSESAEAVATKKRSDLSARAAVGLASLRAVTRNPVSLRVDRVLGVDDGTICYQYRADTIRKTAALLPKAKSVTKSPAAWNEHCANKSGQDVTYRAESMMK